eukprot:535500-Rhodomonas_salina.1
MMSQVAGWRAVRMSDPLSVAEDSLLGAGVVAGTPPQLRDIARQMTMSCLGAAAPAAFCFVEFVETPSAELRGGRLGGKGLSVRGLGQFVADASQPLALDVVRVPLHGRGVRSARVERFHLLCRRQPISLALPNPSSIISITIDNNGSVPARRFCWAQRKNAARIPQQDPSKRRNRWEGLTIAFSSSPLLRSLWMFWSVKVRMFVS